MKKNGIAPLLVYLAAAILLTQPLILHLGNRIGGMADASEYLWDLVRVAWDLVHLHSPLYTHWIFAPSGLGMALNAQDAFAGVLLAPLTLAWGGVVAHNLGLLILLAMNATAMYLLAGEFLKGTRARYLAGGIYGFSPYLLAHADAGHINLITAFWLPLLVWVLLRLEKGTLSLQAGALLLALFGAGLIWTDQELTVFAALLVLFLFGRRLMRLLVPLAWGAAGAALLTLPYWIALAHTLSSISLRSPLMVDEAYAADLLNYLIPGPFEIWGTLPVLWHLSLHAGFPLEETEFLGLGVLFLLPWVLPFAWRRPPLRPFLRLLALSFLLSLGPYLRVAGIQTGLPLPALLLIRVPVLGLLREEARFGLLVSFALAILVGAWWDAREGGLAPHPQRLQFLLLVGVQYLSILPVFMPLTPVRVPLALQAAARQDRGKTILVLPFGFLAGNVVFTMPRATSFRYQALQTSATGPLAYRLVDGYVSKLPTALVAKAEGNPFLADLWRIANGKKGPGKQELQRGLLALIRRDRLAAVVLLPHGRASQGWMKAAQEALGGTPCRTYADGSRFCRLGQGGPVTSHP